MLINIDSIKLIKLSKYIELASEGFAVLETSEIPLKLEVVEHLKKSHEILLVDFKNIDSTKYKTVINESKYKVVVIINPLYAFHSVEDACREINGSRDIYKTMNKLFVFILEPCIVDYLISHCMSFWSCVVLHENFNTLSFNPFSYKSMMEYRIQKRNTNEQVEVLIKNDFCKKFNCDRKCEKFEPNICYYYSSINEEWSALEWINSCVNLGDFFYKNTDYSHALKYYNSALYEIKYNNLDISINYIMWRKAVTLYDLRNFEGAIAILNDLIESEERILFSAQLRNDLGVVLLQSSNDSYNNKELAYACFKNSLNILEEYNVIDTKDYLKKVYYNLAIFYYNSNNFKCCMDYVNRLNELQCLSTQNDYDYYFFSQFMLIKYGCFNDRNLKKYLNYGKTIYSTLNQYYKDLFKFIYSFYLFSNNVLGSSLKELKKINKPKKNQIDIDNLDYLRLYTNVLSLQGICLFYVNDIKKSSYFFKRLLKHFTLLHDKANIINTKKIINKLKDKL